MSKANFLYDVLFKRYEFTYEEWLVDQSSKQDWLNKHRSSIELGNRERADRSKRDAALQAEKEMILVNRRAASENHRFESEKLRLEAMRQEVQDSPERLSQLREYEAECTSLKRQIREREECVGQGLDLDELRRKLETAESRVRAEREPKPKAATEPPVTPYLSEERLKDITNKCFKVIAYHPEKDVQAMLLSSVRETWGTKYGPLVAEEIVRNIQEMLAE